MKGTASGKIIGISISLIWRFQATAVQIIALMEGNGHVSSYRFSQRRCWQPYFFKASKTKFSSETSFSFPSSGFWLKSLVLVSEIICSFCLKGYASQRYVPARTMIQCIYRENTHTHREREGQSEPQVHSHLPCVVCASFPAKHRQPTEEATASILRKMPSWSNAFATPCASVDPQTSSIYHWLVVDLPLWKIWNGKDYPT